MLSNAEVEELERLLQLHTMGAGVTDRSSIFASNIAQTELCHLVRVERVGLCINAYGDHVLNERSTDVRCVGQNIVVVVAQGFTKNYTWLEVLIEVSERPQPMLRCWSARARDVRVRGHVMYVVNLNHVSQINQQWHHTHKYVDAK